MSPLAIAISVELIEGARRDAGGHHGKHCPGEDVGHVELTGTARDESGAASDSCEDTNRSRHRRRRAVGATAEVDQVIFVADVG